MVGLTPERPQRGKSGIRSLAKLATNFDAEFKKHCVDVDQGRPTAEKVLQSWMLAEAYRNDRRMVSLNTASEATASPVELVFVADEIALPTTVDGKGRIVCDILALRQGSEGDVPVVIELKTERQLTRLVEQVTDYAALVDAHPDMFTDLLSVMLSEDVRFAGPSEKWIVWPIAGSTKDPREDELGDAGIRLAGYRDHEHGFAFRVGGAPR